MSKQKSINRALMSAVAFAAMESMITRPMQSLFYDEPKPQPRTPWQSEAEKIAKAKVKRDRRNQCH